MNRRDMIIWAALFALSAVLIGGFVSAASQMERKSWDSAQPWVDLAKAHLAASLGIPADRICVQGVEAVEFSDSSLGVPEAGQVYLTVVTPGYVIRLVTGGETYQYHAGGNRVILAG